MGTGNQRRNGRNSFRANQTCSMAHVKLRRRRRLQPRMLVAFSFFVSLLSFAICFPSGDGIITKLKADSRAAADMNPRQAFCPTCIHLLPQSTYSPEVPLLLLPSTSRDTRSKIKKSKRKSSNRITIETVDGVEKELPLRTSEYRRRKHEWAERYTSQEGLREAFGRNRNRLWGDLDAKTARRLYKRLLFPTAISELVLELGDEIVRPEELAPLAYEARKAAKMYVRERCRVPSRVGAYLFDGFRQLRKYGKFQPNGVSYEQLWIRYYEENGSSRNSTEEEFKHLLGQNASHYEENHASDDHDENVIDDDDDAVTEEEIVKLTCQKILEKSCTTNAGIDRFYLKGYNPNESGEEESDLRVDNGSEDVDKDDYILRGRKGYGQRWRNRKKRKDRYNDLLLQKITKTLERDVRKLLEPPPSSLSSSTFHREGGNFYRDTKEENEEFNQHANDFGNSETIRIEGDWSSRRMTRQEYHSLKLFAKARKHSQLQDREMAANVTNKRAISGDITLKDIASDTFASEAKIAIADRECGLGEN